jgi:serine/threonine protein kinase
MMVCLWTSLPSSIYLIFQLAILSTSNPAVRWLTVLLFPAVNLNHFKLLRVVGKGAFGKVRIVERKDTGLTFALKYIRKDEGQWWSTVLKTVFD